MTTVKTIPTGAEISAIDLSQALDALQTAQIRAAYHEHGVLLFRRQQLSEEQQLRFSRVFGQPVRHPTSTLVPGPVPEITVISNVEESGQAVGALGNSEVHFHADLIFLHTPGTFSVLYAVEVPAQGGDTSWADGCSAYDALDDKTKERIADLRVVYSHSRPEYNPNQPASHPLVSTHPETGRKSLYFSPNHAQYIEGIDTAESDDLLTFINDHYTAPRFVWTHTWQKGDLVVWDNRRCLHRREPFDKSQRRLMKRTQGIGKPSV
ncbi:MAG: TauD/TfdA dioxygenase family protein [Candidatus Latescibacterota bacterium]|jgi:taurine dioxygenase